MTQDKFWTCKSPRQCSEFMAHQAMAEVERLRELLQRPGIREQTRSAARIAIREHMAYAQQVMGQESGRERQAT